MKLDKSKRNSVENRTLENLQEQLQRFRSEGQSDIKQAKKFFNVIHEPLIDIPIDQVSFDKNF